MNHSNRRIVLTVAVALVTLLSDLGPASAMGRSSSRSFQLTGNSALSAISTRTGLTAKPTDAALQSQMDNLRKELADLKA